MNINDTLVVVRGAGDIATGTLHCLQSCGFKVVALETTKPTAIRRYVAFCEAVYDGQMTIDNMTARCVSSIEEIEACFKAHELPLVVDQKAELIKVLKPQVVVDAILAKKNFGTTIGMAPLVIGLGPGFTAKKDVDIVIETMRGHQLGKIITEGSAQPNTGIPGVIAGFGKERVIHAPAAGILTSVAKISDVVSKGQTIAYIGETPVASTLDGVLRGLIRDGFDVPKGMKIADIDPRITEQQNCFSISDKARTIAGSVLQAILMYGDKS